MLGLNNVNPLHPYVVIITGESITMIENICDIHCSQLFCKTIPQFWGH